ncbi:MAG: DUF6036 family nucleotidyltransferase [Planctomycetota bacterium]
MLATDFKDMLTALDDAKADYLVVGAYALGAHGLVRATGDIDIWVRPTPENAQKVWDALVAYKAPRRNLTVEDLYAEDTIYQVGLPPFRIDILTSISGVEFDSAWQRRETAELEDDQFPILSKEDLLANKLASGRPKDLADAAWLKDHQ